MLTPLLLVLSLPCLGMAALFLVYFCLLRYAIFGRPDLPPHAKPLSNDGLSASELHQLPRITGQDILTPTECAVCLADIEKDHPVRLIPACNHGFHLECADTWLALQASYLSTLQSQTRSSILHFFRKYMLIGTITSTENEFVDKQALCFWHVGAPLAYSGTANRL